ncbi:uncharacterized protein AC631_03854 [Debaryomyces fabryi]|uniref:PH domain-containing protein n=1 Tax=Debaryomyces fabryi TaxID=58627 RepID=A0A0V1PVV2_9ASCO|nr:uncharacterized protein AC631_03854 [Debaryomyces fabryi]KSA00382.1 hypothetical protein AC631_03854 [Debaryomyces fabryi]CUM52339.1 unnamed protein product [Debaryomyces fabryi]
MVTDHTNPLAVLLPYTFNSQNDYPTEVLANRFQAWRSIIKDLVNYLKEYASVQEEIVRQQMRLQQAVGISPGSSTAVSGSNSGHGHGSHNNHKEDINAINKFFLPIGNGSIQDLPTILTKFHQQNVTHSSKTLKDINSIIIPKLEELRKDLLIKIKEIKNLQNDFKNNLGKEINETKQALNQYTQAIEFSNKLEHGGLSQDGDHSKNDPYLMKIKLDRQLKKQISEETYLHDAYSNLQTAGGKLESIIVLEIQNYLSTFLNLLNAEHSTIPDYLLPNLNNGFLSKEAEFEWNSFISRNLPTPSISVSALGNNSSNVKNGTFVDLSFPYRKVSELVIPEGNSPLNVAVREGPLERRSKFLKSYSSGWYVLTCNYIHEFKTSDRKKDMQPVMSLLLDACQVSEHSKNDGKAGGVYKFVLHSKLLNGIIHRGHNWVFRTDTYQKMIDWYTDIKSLTNASTASARARIVSKKFKLEENQHKRISRTSSILSNGTNAKSLRTITTNNSSKAAGGSIRSKHKSPTMSHNRLSSTFSRTNNQSPRLTNMVNSDGTMIAPVDVNQDVKTSSASHLNVQHSSPQQHTAQLNYQAGYYYPSNGQPLQLYDPVQQQYYTISPTVQGQPQPQYFPVSPQQNSQQQFFIHAPTGRAQSPVNQAQPQPQVQYFPVNSANYGVYPQQPNKDGSSPNNLPYPTHLQPSAAIESNQHGELGLDFLKSDSTLHHELNNKDSSNPLHENGEANLPARDTNDQEDKESNITNDKGIDSELNIQNSTNETSANELETLQSNDKNNTFDESLTKVISGDKVIPLTPEN